MQEYVFNVDWTKHFIPNAKRLFGGFKDCPLTYLKVGVLEGRSACFMLDEILQHDQSRMVGVDIKLLPLAKRNLERHASKVTLIEGNSADVLPSLTERFDIIYVDACHNPKDCLIDSVNAWRLSKRFIIWDDFRNMSESCCGVWRAVRNFIDCLPAHEYRIVVDNWQMGIEKL